MWRNRFGRGFGPVVRQNTEWMNEVAVPNTPHFHFIVWHENWLVGISCWYYYGCRPRRGCAAACLPGFRVRIPPGAWSVSFKCCVSSHRCLCVALITRPEKSYLLRYVVVYDSESSIMSTPWYTGDCWTIKRILSILFVKVWALWFVLVNSLTGKNNTDYI